MNEKMTLEMTNGGKYLDDLKLFEEESVLTKAQAAEVWKKLSEKYAQQASGNAYGFVKGSWEGSIFNTIKEWNEPYKKEIITPEYKKKIADNIISYLLRSYKPEDIIEIS